MNAQRMDLVIRHCWSEPKAVAQIEWWDDHPPFASQLMDQVGWQADGFLSGRGWVDPNQEVTLVQYEEPDWDWWEPRHDQPWRRQEFRSRELASLLASDG